MLLKSVFFVTQLWYVMEVRIRFLDPVRKGWVVFWKECDSLAASCSCKVSWSFYKLLWAWMEFYEPIKLQTCGSASECLTCFRDFCLTVLEEHINISAHYQPKFLEPLSKYSSMHWRSANTAFFVMQKIQFGRQRWY